MTQEYQSALIEDETNFVDHENNNDDDHGDN